MKPCLVGGHIPYQQVKEIKVVDQESAVAPAVARSSWVVVVGVTSRFTAVPFPASNKALFPGVSLLP